VILLDTTVLVYAVGADQSLRDPCRRVIDAGGRGELAATTTVDVISTRLTPADSIPGASSVAG